MKPVVRQMRGPGMNLGLKKPRFAQARKPADYKPSKEMTAALSVDTEGAVPAKKNKSPLKGGKFPPSKKPLK